MDALQIIGTCVCFLAVITLAAIPVYQGWKDGDLFPEKKEKKSE
jgi:hypothetical protein